MALIGANCNDFFSSAAQNQKWIIFSRDTVAAVGTLATSILSLTNAGKTAVSAVAIGTGAGFTGLDLYTKDFLFSAENISSVRDLTISALSAHKAAALSSPAASYPEVVLALQYEQDLCTPMRIASLVRQAIAVGHGVASSPAAISPQDAAQDAQVLSDLGKILNPASPLDLRHAGALWWLFLGFPTSSEATNYIYPVLDDLSVMNGKSENWANSLKSNEIKNITSDLLGFSAQTQATIKQSIAAQQQAEIAQAIAKQNADKATEIAQAAQAAANAAKALSAPNAASATAAANAAAASAAAAMAAVPKRPKTVILGAPTGSTLSRITVTIH
ncbi:hypothetical protein [Burkholderia vietnamiensis]|uniref:hypothetical protein n=1 Tax=Burkholderia vietnamiensis TaxID=60552 RepID=UPI001BA20C4C|nr:hypothetical protein [Burkholderia vietnamiensis]MBR8279087.1 hypothetical protein [Burkholderia vietnamiensis]